jgi:hypothetical protein
VRCVRALSVRKIVLSLALHSSSGSTSGAYAGRYSPRAPVAAIRLTARAVRELHLIQKHEVGGAQFGREQRFTLPSEALPIDRPFTRHWCQDPAPCQGAENRNVPTILAGLRHPSSFSPGRTGRGARHRRIERHFIHKHQRWRGQARLVSRKIRPRYRVRFPRPPGLFSRVRAQASTQRQTVLTLTLTRVLFLLPSRSSARVASGCSAPKSTSTSRSVLSSLGLAPPPCGNGANSLGSRRCRSTLYTYEERT